MSERADDHEHQQRGERAVPHVGHGRDAPGRPAPPPPPPPVSPPPVSSPTAPSDLIARARAWLAEDPDPATRAELAALLEAGDAAALAELADRFSGTLRFGTAGLRGEMGAGPMRMNRAVVIRAAAGLAAYLRRRAGAPASGPGQGLVVIGYDARHRSADFARDTAAVITGAGGGLRAALLPRPLPTPVLAFAVRHLGAAAGVAVTASHNPPRDNGYKVYLGDGCQIVPPADAEIAAEIDAVGPLDQVPRPSEGWQLLGEEIVEAYLARSGAALTTGSARGVSVVYTPLHGVGQSVLSEAFARAGFPAPIEVAEQSRPDPDFPTVAFPNPEEPGAMDRALAVARAADPAPDLVIANDPDADRCAVGVPAPDVAGGWRMVRGDELGALLAAHLIRKGVRGTFAASIVSSSLVGRMAAAAGLPYAETLTGFKWLARVPDLAFAYEEALGYCVDPAGVRDKDGITAALLVAELAAELKAEGRSLTGLLDALALSHGLHATDQLSVRVAELPAIDAMMRRLRAAPPHTLAGRPVLRAEDLSRPEPAGRDRDERDERDEGDERDERDEGKGLPPTDALRFTTDTARVIVRPSGTEPKLKCYLEVVSGVRHAAALSAARREAAITLRALKRDLAAAMGHDDPHPDT